MISSPRRGVLAACTALAFAACGGGVEIQPPSPDPQPGPPGQPSVDASICMQGTTIAALRVVPID